MKVLVTGAGGFLGQRIVNQLKSDANVQVVVMARQTSTANSDQQQAVRVTNVIANLLDRNSLKLACQGVDLIIHAAAGTKGAAADMYLNSVVGTRNIVEAASEAGVKRILLVSSFSVYQTVELATNATIDESIPLESTGVQKGTYAYTKTQQEKLFRQWIAEKGIEYVVVRPGVIYGPGSSSISPRVGIGALGMFASIGRGALLPLTYVDNCAAAIIKVALSGAPGEAYNIVDDDLITCSEFLRQYQRNVKRLRVVPLHYPVYRSLVKFLVWYSAKSKGQVPAIINDYIAKSMHRPFRYSNVKLKSLNWKPEIPTSDGLGRMFTAMRTDLLK